MTKIHECELLFECHTFSSMSRDYLGSSLIFGVLKKLNIIVHLNSLYVYEFVVKLASMHITSTYFKKNYSFFLPTLLNSYKIMLVHGHKNVI